MRHQLDRPVDVVFEAFQKRLRTRELHTPELNDQNRRLFSLPSQLVVREAFIADRIVAVSDREWTAQRIAERQSRLS